MIQEHPITPPPELTQEWSCDCPLTDPFSRELYVATQAARWGADQELKACCELLKQKGVPAWSLLRLHRRPKPPSLKEQALQELDLLKADATTHGLGFNATAIRRALESLPD